MSPGARVGPDAAARFHRGEPVLVGDAGDPVVFVAGAAARIDAAALACVRELAGGLTVLGVAEDHATRLGLRPLADRGRADLGLSLCSPVDAARGLRGGWSLAEQARTIRTAAASGGTAADLVEPGHVHPARIDADATPAARGALELSRFAGRATAVVLGAVCDEAGNPIGLSPARERATVAGLPHVSSAGLRAGAILARTRGRTVDCALPTREGAMRAIALDEPGGETGCVALVPETPGPLDPDGAGAPPPVHLHVACPLGDALGSLACSCAAELAAARREVIARGRGVVLHVRPRDPLPRRCAAGAALELAPAIALLVALGLDPAALRRSS